MRKLFNLFAAALVVLAAVSCEKSEVLPCDAEGKVVTLSATIDNGGTKTSLGEEKVENVYPVFWSEGDEIAVIQGTNVYRFTLVGKGGTTSGTFTSSNAEGFDPTKEYKAFYPSDDVSVEDNGAIKYSIPSEQQYAPNSFGPGAMPMVATVNSGTTMTFNNLFGVVKIVVDGDVGETISSIEFGSTIPLCGRGIFENDGFFTINFRGNGITYYPSNITLECNTSIEDPKEFLIAIPTREQRTHSDNQNNVNTLQSQQFAIVLHTSKGSYYKSVSGDKAIIVGNILKMPTIDLIEDREDMTIAYGGNNDLMGTLIGKTVWAPVNVGYDSNNKYGELKQWGANLCPTGWRVPTIAEFQSLHSTWIGNSIDNKHIGMSGIRLYDGGDKDRRIFLPAAGIIIQGISGVQQQNSRGYYWASYSNGKNSVYFMGDDLNTHNFSSEYLLSVRCVKE